SPPGTGRHSSIDGRSGEGRHASADEQPIVPKSGNAPPLPDSSGPTTDPGSVRAGRRALPERPGAGEGGRRGSGRPDPAALRHNSGAPVSPPPGSPASGPTGPVHRGRPGGIGGSPGGGSRTSPGDIRPPA